MAFLGGNNHNFGGGSGDSNNRQGPSMYSVLGNYNAELRQYEVRILAEEDVIAHLTCVQKELQEEYNSLAQRSTESQLQSRLQTSDFENAKSRKASIQKEIDESKIVIAELKERLDKRERQIGKLKTEKRIKAEQFDELFRRRQAFYDSTPEGKILAEARDKVAKLKEARNAKKEEFEKKTAEVQEYITASNEKWADFTKDCIQVAERWKKMQILKKGPVISQRKSAANRATSLSAKDRSASGWSDLYKDLSMFGQIKRPRLPSSMTTGSHPLKEVSQSFLALQNALREENSFVRRPQAPQPKPQVATFKHQSELPTLIRPCNPQIDRPNPEVSPSDSSQTVLPKPQDEQPPPASHITPPESQTTLLQDEQPLTIQIPRPEPQTSLPQPQPQNEQPFAFQIVSQGSQAAPPQSQVEQPLIFQLPGPQPQTEPQTPPLEPQTHTVPSKPAPTIQTEMDTGTPFFMPANTNTNQQNIQFNQPSTGGDFFGFGGMFPNSSAPANTTDKSNDDFFSMFGPSSGNPWSSGGGGGSSLF